MQKQKQAKPDEANEINKGLKFESLQVPDVSESLAIGQKAEQAAKEVQYRCTSCGATTKDEGSVCRPVPI